MQNEIPNEKPTMEEVKSQLEALGLPDVTVDEILTLVREPLAHVAFKTEAGDCIRVFTQSCVFVLHVPSLRVMVDVPVTVQLHEAAQIVKQSGVLDAPPKNRRQRREKPAPDVRPVVHKPQAEIPAAEDIDEGLEEDSEAVVPSKEE